MASSLGGQYQVALFSRHAVVPKDRIHIVNLEGAPYLWQERNNWTIDVSFGVAYVFIGVDEGWTGWGVAHGVALGWPMGWPKFDKGWPWGGHGVGAYSKCSYYSN